VTLTGPDATDNVTLITSTCTRHLFSTETQCHQINATFLEAIGKCRLSGSCLQCQKPFDDVEVTYYLVDDISPYVDQPLLSAYFTKLVAVDEEAQVVAFERKPGDTLLNWATEATEYPEWYRLWLLHDLATVLDAFPLKRVSVLNVLVRPKPDLKMTPSELEKCRPVIMDPAYTHWMRETYHVMHKRGHLITKPIDLFCKELLHYIFPELLSGETLSPNVLLLLSSMHKTKEQLTIRQIIRRLEMAILYCGHVLPPALVL